MCTRHAFHDRTLFAFLQTGTESERELHEGVSNNYALFTRCSRLLLQADLQAYSTGRHQHTHVH